MKTKYCNRNNLIETEQADEMRREKKWLESQTHYHTSSSVVQRVEDFAAVNQC